MRVLLITNYFPPHYVGGAEIVVYHTCHGLVVRGVDASVLMVTSRLPQRTDLHRSYRGVDVHQVTYPPYWLKVPLLQAFDPRIYWAVRSELRRLQPDLVHVHNVAGSTLAPFAACRHLRVPVVATLHDHWLLCPNNMLYQGDGVLCDPATPPSDCALCFRRQDFWGNIRSRRSVFANLVRDVRLFLSPSQRLIDLHVAAGYDPARFRVVPYGIDPADFQPLDDPLLRVHAQQSALYHTLLFAGAIAESKGIGTLLEALPLLARYVDRFRLWVAGAGDGRLLSQLGRFEPTTVKLLGKVPFEQMRALYARADLTVVPSTWYENSPMVIYESLLAGTPVVGARIGGIPELLQQGQTGYLFPSGDALALVEAVIGHFALPARERRTMRRRCARYASAHLTIDPYLDRLQHAYTQALRDPPPASNRHADETTQHETRNTSTFQGRHASKERPPCESA